MGLETLTLPEINEYEALNHADNIHTFINWLLDESDTLHRLSLGNFLKSIDMKFGITGLGGIEYLSQQADSRSQTNAENISSLDSRVDLLEAGSGSIIGEIRLWPVLSPPAKWMLCQGQAISRTTYATLFSILGDTYGDGDGSTTFNLPDFRGRSPIGAGQGENLTQRSLGEQIGNEIHTLSDQELPSHTHTGPSHTHPMPHTHTGPSHTHPMPHTPSSPSQSHPGPNYPTRPSARPPRIPIRCRIPTLGPRIPIQD
jgi:microcystin-dependent protein